MLTDDDVIADLSRLRERGAGIEYAGEIPLTRRSLAATVVPVAALAAAASLGAAAVVSSGDAPGAGAGPTADNGSGATVGGMSNGTTGTATPTDTIRLVSAKITLGGRTISYRHEVGEDPFGDGWQLAVDFGTSLPAGATRFDLGNGELVWVADAPSGTDGQSVMVVAAGPHDHYVGAPSSFSRADLEDFVRSNLHGQ